MLHYHFQELYFCNKGKEKSFLLNILPQLLPTISLDNFFYKESFCNPGTELQ